MIIAILSLILTTITVYHFGLTLAAGFALCFVWSLIVASMIDFKHQILPDTLTLPILWLGLFANIFGIFTSLQEAVLGAMAGYLSLWTIYWIFKLITKKEGMGYGDFKLFALLGAWLGWQALPLILFIASLVGSVVGISLILLKKQDKTSPMPFGPYLSLAGVVSLLFV
jgi:leader peptidase (prepilin peptidase)/N-methyltransferase